MDENYNLNDQEEFFNTEENKTVEKEDITPWEMIQIVARKFNFKIHNPDKNCRKCYGRGYTGILVGTKQPVICNCIFEKEEKKDTENRPLGVMNRKQKRQNQKVIRRLYGGKIKRIKEKIDNGEITKEELEGINNEQETA